MDSVTRLGESFARTALDSAGVERGGVNSGNDSNITTRQHCLTPSGEIQLDKEPRVFAAFRQPYHSMNTSLESPDYEERPTNDRPEQARRSHLSEQLSTRPITDFINGDRSELRIAGHGNEANQVFTKPSTKVCEESRYVCNGIGSGRPHALRDGHLAHNGLSAHDNGAIRSQFVKSLEPPESDRAKKVSISFCKPLLYIGLSAYLT
ncbi:unnamed protein product [Protopolystoma xenopodis]|uniref:Uncharacterized protein n=1 Tax=Protopolystoma xenopodis TaxID=117903 RepID=A0A448WTA3_9PLAT|nr:unnamed protein product [Protopolystoma xenopodis]